ncbi:HAMP domain-containing sensor histidine kinase [Flammeovirga kamogawensis]|uniref:histidine kinase n=1 Tax=Flammeovirga kamogawensis TaxID=373891 RepID=A0ABX8GUT9_9BACT|nr:HAMP domain-containing sensor histidine kinase [Flammeovirga kamogawensis]MBB6459575.1 signal transduction histidine kinase [Flammeovirga kamogawensis]QWG07360.1 HAMP domain-containing histidine kinase [Flammeovirga kamogawensis]TRX69176.1 HAMP domain-containing histidine kinase [Flammeovirga kamogawensis]
MNYGSLRGRILTVFISFSVLFSCISFITYKYIHRSEELDQVKAWLMHLEVSVLDLIKQDASDIVTDLSVNYISEESLEEFVNSRENRVALVSVSIDKLLNHEQINEWGLESNLFFIDSLIDQYNKQVHELILAKKSLGSDSTGLYGSMYKNAQILSDLPKMNYVRLYDEMQLNGMKYLLDPKTSYVLSINRSAGQLQYELEKDGELKHFSKAVEEYLKSYNEIVLIHYKIGNNNREGLKGKLNNTASYVESEFDSLSTDVSKRFLTLMWKIKFSYLLVSLVAVLFTVVVGYYTASRVSNPITVLQDRTRKIIESGYVMSGGEVDFKELKKPTREVAALASSFQEMYEMIQNQFAELEQGNRKLKNSKKKLMETNRVKDQFFSIISHDLKGPINTQLGFLKLLMERSDAFSPEEIQILAKEMHGSMKNLMGLMENLLAWSRSESQALNFDIVKTDIGSIINRNVDLLRPVAKEKSILLNAEINHDKSILADQNSLDCVLRNIISNAIKFTSANGKGIITIATSNFEDKVEVSVTDNGNGMTEKELKKLLDTSVQFSKKGTAREKGVGLGMILVQDFVKRNKGELFIDSQPNIGTRCSILFDTYKVAQNKKGSVPQTV